MAGNAKARGIPLDQKSSQSAGTLRRIHGRKHQKYAGLGCAGYKSLLSVQNIRIAVASCRGAKAEYIRPRARLGHRMPAYHFAIDELRQKPLFQSSAGKIQNWHLYTPHLRAQGENQPVILA